jgi:hypothetical protein
VTTAAARTSELDRLLETVTYIACEKYAAQHLVIDRSGELTNVMLRTASSELIDLWTVDPLLWDDAHWAATRSVPAGAQRTVYPVLHNN